MKFLRKNKKAKKFAIIISDLHLGAGVQYNGRRNLLEDFHFDQEFVEFLKYYSTNEYADAEVELIINGDFLDLLAVPFVKYFDDEFWSEKAGLEKLKICCEAHPEAMEALDKFLSAKGKSLNYILGNHDCELVFDSLKEYFLSLFKEENQKKITINNENVLYSPVKGVYIQHGHEYEIAHQYDPMDTTITSQTGEKYFIPSWGSYYVTHVVNKYKQEKEHINAVRPIKNFLIHGFIFDTFFTIRLIIANVYFFIMMRFMQYFKSNGGWKGAITNLAKELELFQDFETLTQEFFEEHDDAKVLIVGHTHKPTYSVNSDNNVFINTGTWTRMIGLDLEYDSFGISLTYALISIENDDFEVDDFDKNVEVVLNKWVGKNEFPFEQY